MRKENSYTGLLWAYRLAKINTYTVWSNRGTSHQTSRRYALGHCLSVTNVFCGDYKVAGGWHLRKVETFLRDQNGQTDRKKETEKRIREERLVISWLRPELIPLHYCAVFLVADQSSFHYTAAPSSWLRPELILLHHCAVFMVADQILLHFTTAA